MAIKETNDFSWHSVEKALSGVNIVNELELKKIMSLLVAKFENNTNWNTIFKEKEFIENLINYFAKKKLLSIWDFLFPFLFIIFLLSTGDKNDKHVNLSKYHGDLLFQFLNKNLKSFGFNVCIQEFIKIIRFMNIENIENIFEIIKTVETQDKNLYQDKLMVLFGGFLIKNLEDKEINIDGKELMIKNLKSCYDFILNDYMTLIRKKEKNQMESFHCLILLVRMILKFDTKYFERSQIHINLKDYLVFCVNLLIFIYADSEVSKGYINEHQINVRVFLIFNKKINIILENISQSFCNVQPR